MIAENLLQAGEIAHIGYDGMNGQKGEGLTHLEQGFKNTILTVSEKKQLGRTPTGNLAAQFTADGPSCPCHQHHPPGQACPHQFIVDARRFTAQ